MEKPPDDECVDLLKFEIAVFRCANKIVPFDEMLEIFNSNTRAGTLMCLLSHIYWIYKLVDSLHAYEFARALFETGVERNSSDLVFRSVELYLKRRDADLRLVPYFERRCDYLRQLDAQFLIRSTILEHHRIQLQSHCSECDNMISYLASFCNSKYVKMADLAKMHVSPSTEMETRAVTLSTSDKIQNMRRKQVEDNHRDGNQSE